jgi:hypothetical protein
MEIPELLELLQRQWEEGDWLLSLGFLRDELQHWQIETAQVIAEVPDSLPLHDSFLGLDFTAVDEEAYYDALNEALTLVEEAIQLVAVQAGQVVELERTQPGGISMTPILPPWDMVKQMVEATDVPASERVPMEASLESFWRIAADAELPWDTVRRAAIAAADLDYNLFFMLISYLLERRNNVV